MGKILSVKGLSVKFIDRYCSCCLLSTDISVSKCFNYRWIYPSVITNEHKIHR